MFDPKRDVKKALKEYLEMNPSSAPEFLEVISDALQVYEASVKLQRNKIAQNGLLHLYGYVLDSDRFNKLKNAEDHHVPAMIDAMFVSFPEGQPTMHAPVEREIFRKFQEMCITLDMLNDETEKNWAGWLLDVKGWDYYNWMCDVLAYNFEKDEQNGH